MKGSMNYRFSKINRCWFHLLFLINNDKKLSPHMDKIFQHIRYSYNKIHSYYKMSITIVNLSNKKGDKMMKPIQNSLI